jgi:hypothetical protein
MKTNQKIVLLSTIVLLSMIFACKESEASADISYDSQTEAMEETVEETEDVAKVASSSAAEEPKNTNRKFLRTADIKLKVKNVANSTENIENATNKFGGFVTYTNLESNINEKTETRVSQDSILETLKYTVTNTMTIRVPSTKLDTLVKTIAKEIDFLDARLIKAEDVTLLLLSNEMARKRSSGTQ